MLDDSGTQLDELDFVVLSGPLEMSPEQSLMIAKITQALANWSEDMEDDEAETRGKEIDEAEIMETLDVSKYVNAGLDLLKNISPPKSSPPPCRRSKAKLSKPCVKTRRKSKR